METICTSATGPNHRRMGSNSPALQAGLRCVAVAAVLLALPLAYAADPLPPMQSQGDVQFVTGGIGQDEVDAMKQAEAQFPLTLEFATSAEKPAPDASAPFVSDAAVDIRDAQGRGVLSTRSDGPLLLVRLPSGSYTIEAQWNGVRKQRTVALANDRRQHVMFDFASAEPPPN